MKDNLKDKVVLITGGTGSFGRKFAAKVLREHQPSKLIIYSRDEMKQFEMAQVFNESKFPNIRYFIGDIRDRERLYRALDGVDIVIHAAALKIVPAAEYNPIEFVRTNILGAANLIDAAIDRRVERVIALSTDKAANPVNLYGATKLCSDKLFVAANSYAGAGTTRFAVVRYGNVVGSRGSVIPYFLKMRETGTIPITDRRMTRFLITLDQGVDFVLTALDRMEGGEVFIPKIPSVNIMDLAKVIGPDCKYKVIGIRPGEKLHEVMISADDARNTYEYKDFFIVYPGFHAWSTAEGPKGGKRCRENFSYSSNTNKQWLKVEQLRRMVDMLDK